MVFSQTSVPTRSILKVVELNNLKREPENGTKNGLKTGPKTGGLMEQPQTSTEDILNFSEVYLKPEPLIEDTMLNESDREFFQDLVQWCAEPAKEEPIAIDPLKKREENSYNTDTLHTTPSPHGWDVLDAISPTQAGYYASPNLEAANNFDSNLLFDSNLEDESTKFNESNFDILNMPVVLGDLASENTVDLNSHTPVETVDYYINTIQNTQTLNTNKMLLHSIEEEDSLDMKLGTAILGEIENSDMVAYNEGIQTMPQSTLTEQRGGPRLALNISAPAPWLEGAISTPEVLTYVEQLEKEKMPAIQTPQVWPAVDTDFITLDSTLNTSIPSIVDEPYTPKSTSITSFVDQPYTPRSESLAASESDVDTKPELSKRKRHESEDSDETYTPYNEYTPRKYKRRKPNVPIKDMILALEESQQLPKARRGRPPKRRESNVSSVCSAEDNTSTTSNHEYKYRELRDKNNEASKRSRMNRKLKELQMEQLAIELEERNKKLQVKADILEDMTKRLKDALMTAILQK